MAQVQAFECEECGDLGKSTDLGDGRAAPPLEWLYVSTQVIGEDPEPAKVFCSVKCRGLHFRPIQRRKGGNDESDEEDHSTP